MQTLSVYEELSPLCGRGHVMLVRSSADGQLYVKKRLRPHAPELYRQLLEHPVPGMPRIYEIYPPAEPAGELVIIEEYIPGRTLAEVLAEEGPLSEQDTISVGLALCGILRALHSRKPAILHRDIKPSNIIRQPDGTITLLDLSAAKTVSPGQRRDTELLGTAGFAAPEQYGFSASTTRTDLYSMGVLLNVLRTGELPWERRAQGLLGTVIGRCLMLEPKNRYLDAKALHTALKKVERGYIPWLPPGFRSLCWYKMLPALGYYGLFFLLLCRFVMDALMGEPFGRFFFPVYVFMGLGPVLFYGNWLDIQRFFPFTRSPSRGLRLLGLALFPLWLFLFLVTLLILTDLHDLILFSN